MFAWHISCCQFFWKRVSSLVCTVTIPYFWVYGSPIKVLGQWLFWVFLKNRCLTCNVHAYTGLVYGFCGEGLYEVPYSVLDKMQNDGCKPTVVTYTTVIKLPVQDRKAKEA